MHRSSTRFGGRRCGRSRRRTDRPHETGGRRRGHGLREGLTRPIAPGGNACRICRRRAVLIRDAMDWHGALSRIQRPAIRISPRAAVARLDAVCGSRVRTGHGMGGPGTTASRAASCSGTSGSRTRPRSCRRSSPSCPPQRDDPGDKKRDLVEALIAGEIGLPAWLRRAEPQRRRAGSTRNNVAPIRTIRYDSHTSLTPGRRIPVSGFFVGSGRAASEIGFRWLLRLDLQPGASRGVRRPSGTAAGQGRQYGRRMRPGGS